MSSASSFDTQIALGAQQQLVSGIRRLEFLSFNRVFYSPLYLPEEGGKRESEQHRRTIVM